MGLLSVPLKTVLMYHADITNETLPESYEYCDGRTLNSSQQDINPGSNYTLPDLRNRFILGADLTKGAANAGTSGSAPTDAPGPKGVGGLHAKTLATTELPAHNHTASANSAGTHGHAGSSTDSAGGHTHTNNVVSAGSHTHSGSNTSTAGGHSHAGSTLSQSGNHTHGVNDPGHFHQFRYQTMFVNQSAPDNHVFFPRDEPAWRGDLINLATTGITIVGGGDHTHTLNISTDGSHSHTFTLGADGTHTHTVTIDAAGAHTHSVTLASDGAHTHAITVDNTGGGTAFDMRPRYYGLVFIMKVKR